MTLSERLRMHSLAIRGRIGHATKRDPVLYEDAADTIDALAEVASGLVAFYARIGNGQMEKLDALEAKARAALAKATQEPVNE